MRTLVAIVILNLSLSFWPTLCEAQESSFASECLSVETKTNLSRSGARIFNHYVAKLLGSSSRLSVATIELRKGIRSLDEMKEGNAFLAIGLLTAVHQKISKTCLATLGRYAQESPNLNGPAQLVWQHIQLDEAQNNFKAKNASLTIDQRNGNTYTHVVLVIDGVTSNSGAPVPQSIQAEIRLPRTISAAAQRTHNRIMLDSLEARWPVARLFSHGWIFPGTSVHDSAAELNVRVSKFDDVFGALRAHLTPSGKTILTVASLLSHHQNDQKIWDLSLNQGIILINGMPLPLTLK